MPLPSNITGTPMIGFSDPSTFFIGFSGSGTYPLSGLGWSMVETPIFRTLDQTTQGGREVMNPLYLNPLHAWKLVYNVLNNEAPYSTNPDTDFRLLYSFYLAMNGRFNEFLFKTREAAVVKQELALPDTNGYVELVYANGPFFQESVQEMNSVLPTIYSYNTVSQVYTDRTSDCSFYTAASIPPYSGIVFTSTYTLGEGEYFAWSGTWYYRCHFDKDSYSFEEFMYQLMKVGVGLSQVRI